MNEFLLPDGTTRKLGCIPSTPGRLKAWPVYGETDNTPIIPRTEWKARCDAIGTGPEVTFLTYVHDQDGIGMCNCSATASAMETQRLKQGLPLIKLSGGDLYHRISGGRDQGSRLEDGIHEAMLNGVADENTVPYLDWTRNHSDAPTNRKKYRVLEAFLCPTFDACFSAVLMGFDLISGIMWRDNFNTDRDGWLPSVGRGSEGGHAVHGYKPTYRGNVYGIWHKNSWTESFGLNGKCVFPEWVYGHDISGWWAVRSITDEGNVVPEGN